ncbi:sulfotransferase 2A1-like isoform X2 [Dromiciops gliroides]|nr:sulfotransferase 2A1-like isoform X2 [Dromiciops gliroides]XP_043850092.1 sulfotransferase 2A1-like isoform X2 [Dromiciops gliroides]XP_043850093.1 sulfotransferase 2A1-like isoform X2 [Dromiciops gliroides]
MRLGQPRQGLENRSANIQGSVDNLEKKVQQIKMLKAEDISTEYIKFEGIFFPQFCGIKDLKYCRDEFVVRENDIITMSYPKSGIHWLNEIISLIHCKGDNTWVQSTPIWNRFPWLEVKNSSEFLCNIEQTRPRFYSSHLPIHFFCKSYFHSKAKTIYIMRNPRDVVVSYYYFTRLMKFYDTPESFSHMFEMFSQGTVPYGSWFDHIRGWLSLRGNENFLILTYEELLQDLWGNVEKICHFLGTKLKEEEMNLVIENASFSVMKNNKMSNMLILPDYLIDHSQGSFIRKGIAGDWKNHFTVAQSEAFDKLYRERMRELDSSLFTWEHC